MSQHKEATLHALGPNSSMDQLLAPSIDEQLTTDCPNDADHLHHTLKHDMEAVRSSFKQRSPSAEEKKLDDTHVTDGNASFDNQPVENNSFERALGEIGNEFEHGEGSDDSRQEDTADTQSDGLSSSNIESKRYNDILGLLRNRRQELTAALQKQPSLNTETEAKDDDEEKQKTDEQENLKQDISDEIGEDLVEIETKDTDEEGAGKMSGVDTTSGDEGQLNEEESADSDEKTTAASNRDTKVDMTDAEEDKANQLEKIESTPQETEEERRRRQQSMSPSRRHPVDLHSLSPTPPRSPKRSLPYFHKPSGVTPPASPTFLTGLGDKSPPQKARPELSPKARSDGSVSPSSKASHKPLGVTPPASPTFLTGLGDKSPQQKTRPELSPKARSDGSASPSPKTSASETLARDLPTLPTLMTCKIPHEGVPSDEKETETPSSQRTEEVSPLRVPQDSAHFPPSHRLPDSPQSETGTGTPPPFTIPRSNSAPPKKLDDATTAAQKTVPRSSPPKSARRGSQSPKKPIPPDKIRFRDPYPILRPEKQPRDPQEIIAEYTTPKDHMPIRWVRPKPDLKQLIVAAMGTSLARRSNACGALKVLSKSKKNQMNLFRTDSFMSSLLFCASQNIPEQERDVALDARTRAVACIKAVCEPKMNRYHVVTYPGLLDCLVKVIQTDNGESRSLACGALAFIAKTSDCREEIAKDSRLVQLLAQVLGNRVPVSIPSPVKEEKKEERPSSPHGSSHGGHTDEEDDEHSENTGVAEESTIGDYDTAFAGSLGMLDSFDILSRNNPGSPRPQSDEEGTVEDVTLDDVSYESDLDQPPVDSIRKKNLERNQTFVQESRASACAVLLHLSRECVLSPLLCNNQTVLDNMILVANETSNGIHTRCLEFLFNLTRFPANTAKLTIYEGMLGTLLSLGSAEVPEDRVLALQTFQNLSADQSSKPRLAIESVLTFLTACAVRKDDAEREAAVSTLQNISTEPGAVVAITNTKNAIATLVHLAHSPTTKHTTRHLACESLANISLWLQTLAGTGKVPESVENTLLPTLKTSGWEKWN